MTSVIRMITFACLCAVVGCSGNGGVTVKGNVTFDGKPIEEGSISFQPADGQGPSLGGSIIGGKYEATGPVEAKRKYTVRVDGMRKSGKFVEAGPPAPKGTKVEQLEKYLPATYNEKTILTADLSAGGTIEVNFPLTTSGK